MRYPTKRMQIHVIIKRVFRTPSTECFDCFETGSVHDPGQKSLDKEVSSFKNIKSIFRISACMWIVQDVVAKIEQCNLLN